MEFNHKPVLLEECIQMLMIKPWGIYIDGTLGGAGHSGEIYKRLDEKGTLVGIDRDLTALEVSKERLGSVGKARLVLVHGNFNDIKDICSSKGIAGADGVLLDLGVSSYQLDEGERGFSYQKDAPLDMRMDRTSDLTAEKIVNEYPPERLAQIIRDYGEERWASRIASFIAEARNKKRIASTYELVDIIKAAIPSSARREGPHPAKRTFQAIRIAVNEELEHLGEAVQSAAAILKSGGRLCIITFHSLEDRIVKNTFQQLEDPCTCPADFPVCICGKSPLGKVITRKPVLPSETEMELNPRARSAKLRVLEKL